MSHRLSFSDRLFLSRLMKQADKNFSQIDKRNRSDFLDECFYNCFSGKYGQSLLRWIYSASGYKSSLIMLKSDRQKGFEEGVRYFANVIFNQYLDSLDRLNSLDRKDNIS